jgi:hypothetical protein
MVYASYLFDFLSQGLTLLPVLSQTCGLKQSSWLSLQCSWNYRQVLQGPAKYFSLTIYLFCDAGAFMLGKCSTTELHTTPIPPLLFFVNCKQVSPTGVSTLR